MARVSLKPDLVHVSVLRGAAADGTAVLVVLWARFAH